MSTTEHLQALEPEKPVAKVDGCPITQKQFMLHYSDFVASHKEENETATLSKEEREEIKCEVLNKLIDQQLLISYGKERNFLPTIEQVNTSFNKLTKEFRNRTDFEESLAELGLTEREMMQEISNQLIVDSVIDEEVNAKIQFDDDQLRDFYLFNKDQLVRDTYAISHIYMRLEDHFTDEEQRIVKRRMESALERLQEGYDFGAIAKKVSQCPSGQNQGKLGNLTPEEIDHLFEGQLDEIKEGYLSGVIETQYGFHIVRVGEKIKPEESSFELVKESLRETLQEMLYEEELENLITRLRDHFDIEIFNF